MLDDQLGNGGVVLGRHVEGRRHDLAANGALHVRDLLGALVHEQADEVHLGVVGGDGLADLLQDRGLARLGRAHDEAALALADGCHKIDGTAGDGVLATLHDQALVGIDGGKVAEARAALHGLGVAPVHASDGDEGRILGGILGVCASRANGSLDAIAWTQRVVADELLAYVGVVVALHVVARANPACTGIANLEDALDRVEALGGGSGLVHGLDQV